MRRWNSHGSPQPMSDTNTPPQTPDPYSGPPRCQHCNTPVSRDYHRVFSNDDGVLEHCWSCASRTERY